jgi:hypothetical protein
LTIDATRVIVVATSVAPDAQIFENQAYFRIFLISLCALCGSVVKIFHETAKSGALVIKPSIYKGLSAPKGLGAPVAQLAHLAQSMPAVEKIPSMSTSCERCWRMAGQ